MWKVVFILLLSLLHFVVLHSSLDMTAWSCFWDSFFLCYLLYAQSLLHLFLISPQLVPVKACSLVWASSQWTSTLLPCLSVLVGMCVTCCSIGRQAAGEQLGHRQLLSLAVSAACPMWEFGKFGRRTTAMIKRWDGFHAQNGQEGK